MVKQTCEMPDINPTSNEIEKILTESKTIAIVGLTDKPDKDSYRIARYLQEKGYRIVPVNPVYPEILGETSFKSVRDIPFDVDIVDIFRKPGAIPGIVDDAIVKKAKTVWMQLGLTNNEAADKARRAGLQVVQGRCIRIEHQKLSSD
jgi:uncharacterized protein